MLGSGHQFWPILPFPEPLRCLWIIVDFIAHPFGGFDDECFEAYDDEWPLADGWQARVPLHQLSPLVVHAIKFGGGYAAATEWALDALGRA